MRVMVQIRASSDSEAGGLPSQELFTEMGKFNDELIKAGERSMRSQAACIFGVVRKLPVPVPPQVQRARVCPRNAIHEPLEPVRLTPASVTPAGNAGVTSLGTTPQMRPRPAAAAVGRRAWAFS
jgi:hypothetical protein